MQHPGLQRHKNAVWICRKIWHLPPAICASWPRKYKYGKAEKPFGEPHHQNNCWTLHWNPWWAEKNTGRQWRKQKKRPLHYEKTAGETDDVPGYLPVITNKKYRDAISFNCNSSAFLQVFSDSAAFTYKNSCTSLKGLPATYENIKEYCTNDGMKEVHIPLLMALFGILLLKFSASPDTHRLHETACIYYPELAKRLGKPSTGVKDINAVMGAMEKLKKVIGIVDGGKKSADILPALLSC